MMAPSSRARLRLTRHALQRLIERAIELFEVEEALRNPEEIFYDTETGYLIAVKDRAHRPGHKLLVVYKPTVDVITLISVMDTSSPEELISRRVGKRWVRIGRK